MPDLVREGRQAQPAAGTAHRPAAAARGYRMAARLTAVFLVLTSLAALAAAEDLTLSCRKASGSPNVADRVELTLDRAGSEVRITGVTGFDSFRIDRWSDTAITFALTLKSGTLRGLYRIETQMLHLTTLSRQPFDTRTTLLWGSLFCGQEKTS